MTTVNELFDNLSKFKGRAYESHRSGLPHEAQQLVAQLCEIFEASPPAVRQQILSKVIPDIEFVFVIFSNLMAVSAVRAGDKQRVLDGLVAVVIADSVSDPRDTTIMLAVLYDAAQRIGAEPDELLHAVADIAPSDRTRNTLNSFVARSPENKRLDKFGIKAGTTPTGEFTYTGG